MTATTNKYTNNGNSYYLDTANDSLQESIYEQPLVMSFFAVRAYN